jgi:bifunctional non-homologous end joining protein LigD
MSPLSAMKDLIERYGEVQLATLVDAPPASGNWLHEIKFDGYRLVAFLEKKSVKLFTRNGNDWTARFPSIRESVTKLKATSAVLDMEAVVVEPSGRTSFQALQNALGDGGKSDAIVGYVFDLLYFDGKDVSAAPLTERKAKLEILLNRSKDAKHLYYSEHVAGQGAEFLAKCCALGLEGIVSKLADAPYRSGREKSWLKAKCIMRQEFIIVGFSTAKSGNRAIGALYLGYLKDGELAYAGKVGTGFTMRGAEEVYKKLAPLESGTPPIKGIPRSELRYIHFVKPLLLCEVAFAEWTSDGHIRHGSFQGLREDKKAKDVKRETPKSVKEIVRSSHIKR